MKTLAVVGDSFMATDKRYPNTHFTELLAERLRCELHNYARGGASNHVIYLQLKEILFNTVKLPDFILCGFTSDGRLLMGDGEPNSDPLKDNIELNHLNGYGDNKLTNYVYDSLGTFVFNQELIKGLKLDENIPEKVVEKLEAYISAHPLINQPKVNLSQNIATIIACVSLVSIFNIPFKFYCNYNDPFFKLPNIQDKHYGLHSEYNPWNYTNTVSLSPEGYHTTAHAQKVLADLYEPVVKEYVGAPV